MHTGLPWLQTAVSKLGQPKVTFLATSAAGVEAVSPICRRTCMNSTDVQHATYFIIIPPKSSTPNLNAQTVRSHASFQKSANFSLKPCARFWRTHNSRSSQAIKEFRQGFARAACIFSYYTVSKRSKMVQEPRVVQKYFLHKKALDHTQFRFSTCKRLI